MCVQAHSVSDVAQNGATLNLGPIMVVGRVRECTASPVTWEPQEHKASGPSTDAELESPDKKTVIYGLIAGKLSQGEVVYFPAVVVAVGHTRNGTGTAYVVSLSAAVSTTASSGDVDLLVSAYVSPGIETHSGRPARARAVS